MTIGRLVIACLCAALVAACGSSVHYVPDRHVDADHQHAHARRLVRGGGPVAALPTGMSLPYPIDHVFGTFGDCRDGGRRQHSGIDLGGVGPHAGLGTPIRSMARARVTMLGSHHDDPSRFGRPDRGQGSVERAGVELPKEFDVPGYGTVTFFTRDYGSWHSGAVVVTEVVSGPLAGHQIRYMHLGAIHPELREGDVIEAGQELGLMGGTAILYDLPHVHIDIEDAEGRRIDPAPFMGLPEDRWRCQ